MKPRTWTMRPEDVGKPLGEVVAAVLRVSRAAATAELRSGAVRLAGQVCRDPQRRVRAGDRLAISATAGPTPKRPTFRADSKPLPKPRPSRDPQGPPVRVVFQDAHLVVVDKPPGLTTVRHASDVAEQGARARKYLPPTLLDRLPSCVSGPTQGRFRLRAVHRIDRETSGLVVIARTAEAERALGAQFRAHSVERTYLALVRGVAQTQRIESTLIDDRGDGRRGSGPGGQRAVTQVRVVETLGDFTLVECRLETGRTHQVRIHLGEAGTPLCGERVYDRPLHGRPAPDASGAARPLLHAATLGVDHPTTGRRMAWTAPLPPDFARVLDALRAKAPSVSSTPAPPDS